jgi:hypothetical protein
LKGFELSPFGLATSLNEKCVLSEEATKLCFESCFQAWLFEKGVLET